MILLVRKKNLKFLGTLALIILVILFINNFSLKTFNTVTEPYYEGNVTDSKCVAILCNVDWGEEYINSMLKTLKEENVHITFMVTGRWAKENPEILKKILNSGHEIGNHGYMHYDYSNFDYDANYKQIKKAKDTIEGIINQNTVFFEAPSGYYNKETVRAAKDLRYIPIKWSIDTIDWKYQDDSEAIINRLKSHEIKDGKIILMHPTDATSKSLKTIIQIVKNKGYQCSRLKDIFKVE